MADAIAVTQRIAEGVGQDELSESAVKTLVALVDSFIRGLGQLGNETRIAVLEKAIAQIATAFPEMIP